MVSMSRLLEKPGPALYSPECVEVEFSELRRDGVLRSPQNEPAHREVRRAKVDAILLTCNSNQPIRHREGGR